ncbi:MAG: hypothetical protein LPK58_09760 [Gammaproteobacteria bacterium]|nr:hypothetical protein [Gammaproteobacteria bacterium]MDX5375799.1 hypothetical protein [Gammaproteobacteria bacterium]
MDQQEFQQFRGPLLRFVGRVHQVTAVIVLLAFAGYGAALYAWFQDQQLGALVIATLAYLLFRAFRPISVSLARLQLQRDPALAPLWALIDRDLERHSPAVLIEQIQQLERDAADAKKANDREEGD